MRFNRFYAFFPIGSINDLEAFLLQDESQLAYYEDRIKGMPEVVEGTWDVAWLGENAGWLEGTAFPATAGNTGITAHVWDADNHPGPFVNLRKLGYGDVVEIHAWGYVYTYSVRYNYLTTPTNTAPLHHEEYDWLTLLTCESYSSAYDSYRYRRVVRAVLVDVNPE